MHEPVTASDVQPACASQSVGKPTNELQDVAVPTHCVAGVVSVHPGKEAQTPESQSYDGVPVQRGPTVNVVVPQVGARIVRPIVNGRIVEMIEHHHDDYDGSGLHQGVAGTEIPLGARMIAVADAFDAMISDRPYRAAMSIAEAVEEIERCADTQFDPVIVTAFLKTVQAGAIQAPESQTGASDDLL